MASPPTPQKKGTLRSRVGGVIRRSSTAFSIPGLPNRGNSATPTPPPDTDTASITGSVMGKLDREGSTTSLNKIDTTPPPAPATTSSAPSPIPESPAREAAALAAEPQPAAAKGPSPLANEVLRAEVPTEQGTTPRSVSGTPPAPESIPATTPPPLQGTKPASASRAEIATVLTAEPEEMPAPQKAAPSAPSSRSVSDSTTPPPPASFPPSAAVTPAALSTSGAGYFGDIPRSTTPAGFDSNPDTNVWADQRVAGTVGSESGSEAVRGRALTDRPSKSSMRTRDPSVASSQVVPPQLIRPPVSRRASGLIQTRATELAGVTKTWSNSGDLGLPNKPSVPSQEDTKAVVVAAQTTAAPSPADTVLVHEDIDPRSPRDDSLIAPSAPQQDVPLPAMEEVMAGPLRKTASSDFDPSISENGRYYHRTSDETRPLIPRPLTPPIITSFPPQTVSSQIAQTYRTANPPLSQPIPQWAQPARFDVNGSAHNYGYGSTSRPHAARGWTEYALPHGIRYYANVDNRAVTDLDLRNLTKLDEVTNTIDTSDDVPEGCEMWIRAGGSAKGWRKHKPGSEPVLFWVDHRHRRILNEVPSDDHASSMGDDRLDNEFRYWSFIEMHPAHIPQAIAEGAKKDAIDTLHWSYADRVLSHPHLPPTPPPFSQNECIELFKLLNDPNQPITPAYTRTVARILLRGMHWHQVHFRPNKPLPRDVSHHQPARRTPIVRMVLELLAGILCLGIPFLFADRVRTHGQFDVEASHLPESTTPLFVVGACACLVSAIILSASVTLMSFPGLDSIARIGGLVAITCAVLSMITSFVSIFRYKAEMARGPGPLAEGFVMLSRRSFMLSLPLVFLAYSVAGFVTGVVVFSFRSATLHFAGAGSPVVARFDEYTRFMVVGVLGALVGVLIASTFVARR